MDLGGGRGDGQSLGEHFDYRGVDLTCTLSIPMW
jgi:hypothetical protein